MRFFADRARTEDPRRGWALARERLGVVASLPAGAARHAALAGVLVRAGELAQGVSDAEADRAGGDADGPGGRAALEALASLARALWASFLAGGDVRPPGPKVLDAALAAPLPEVVRTYRAEGFSQYAVYPETYAAAAAALRGAEPTVVGIRSIGAALAAMAVAGAGAARAPYTVRPRGPPFRRVVALAPELRTALAAEAGRPYAVVDEGPGLSGSSFAAVASALASLGVPPGDVHLFPSHPGPPGPEADDGIRALLAGARRHHVAFEELFLGAGPLALPRLAADVLGPLDAAPEDLGAGAWRARSFPDRRSWPPSQGWRERRKYLLRAGGRGWLARFVGLGERGDRALARARTLAAAGLSPEPAALRHGFLLERWEDRAVPLSAARVPAPAVLRALWRHVTFVASRFPAEGGEGASPRELLELTREHAAALLGPGAAADVLHLAQTVPEIERSARPVAVDGRLAPWEWLVRADGSILKADALDHHADHALVGCQDALWDVAGAAVEHGLAPAQGRELAAAVRAAAPGAPPRCLAFYQAAYAAFEAGRWTLAAGDAGVDADEGRRRRQQADRYRRAFRDALSPATAGDRPA